MCVFLHHSTTLNDLQLILICFNLESWITVLWLLSSERTHFGEKKLQGIPQDITRIGLMISIKKMSLSTVSYKLKCRLGVYFTYGDATRWTLWNRDRGENFTTLYLTRDAGIQSLCGCCRRIVNRQTIVGQLMFLSHLVSSNTYSEDQI